VASDHRAIGLSQDLSLKGRGIRLRDQEYLGPTL